MTNLTEQNQYEAGIYQLERTDAVDAGENGNGISNLQAKQLANRTNWLKARAEIRGDWDMTNTITSIVPVTANDLGGTSAVVDANNQTLTPEAPLEVLNGTPSSATFGSIATRKHGLRWGRVRVPDTSGSNLGAFGIALKQIGSSASDVVGALNGVGTAPGDGTYAIYLMSQMGTVALLHVADGSAPVQTLLSSVDPDWVAPGVGEDLYLGIDFSTGKVYVDKTGGKPLHVVTIDFGNESAGLTPGVILGFAGATPTLGAPLNYDFGTTAGGRLPFAKVDDPSLPAGAQDLYRYHVTAGGLFGNKETKAGDIVELRDGMDDLIVTRYPDPNPVQIEDVEAIADERIADTPQPIVRQFLDRREVWGISNDAPATTGHDVNPKDGDGVIVGSTPAGDFAGFSAGDLVVMDGSTWHQVTPWPGMVVQPIVNANGASTYEEERYVRWIYLPNHSSSWDQGVSVDQLNDGGAIPDWYKVRAFSQPLKPLEVDLNNGDSFAIQAQYTTHQAVKALVAGDVSISFGGLNTHEASGLIYLFADTAGGAEIYFSCTDTGGMTFSGFRRAGNDAIPTAPCLHLNEGESAVLRWFAVSDDSAHLVLLGDSNETDQLKVITATNGGTIALTEAHHVINLLTNTADTIAAATIELPFGEVLGAPIILHVTHGIDAVTWTDTHAGASANITSLPATLRAGDAYAIYGGTNTSLNWVAIPLHQAVTRKYQRPYDVATITMIEGERIAHIVGGTAGNRTVKLPPNPVKGDIVEIVKDTSVALDIIVQESDGSAVETVVTGATTGRLTFYWGMDDASPGADAWRRMPAYL